MGKQTAVEWLVDEIEKHYITNIGTLDPTIVMELRRQAKAMEKQQSISDYCEGFKASGEGWNGEYGLKDMLDVAGEIDAEDYYNKTYGGDK
jgi:hypothetical protein